MQCTTYLTIQTNVKKRISLEGVNLALHCKLVLTCQVAMSLLSWCVFYFYFTPMQMLIFIVIVLSQV